MSQLLLAPRRIDQWVNDNAVELQRQLRRYPGPIEKVRQRRHARLNANPAKRRRALSWQLIRFVLVNWAVPQQQVRTLRNSLAAFAVLDSLATYTWVALGVAGEGNPTVLFLIEQMGLGVGLTVRAVASVALVWLVAWLAKWFSEARLALIPITLGLGAITVFHAFIGGTGMAYFLV